MPEDLEDQRTKIVVVLDRDADHLSAGPGWLRLFSDARHGTLRIRRFTSGERTEVSLT
ncbi:hypothetical protein BH24ACT5_BH24ACT5_00480 [soil metagenome]